MKKVPASIATLILAFTILAAGCYALAQTPAKQEGYAQARSDLATARALALAAGEPAYIEAHLREAAKQIGMAIDQIDRAEGLNKEATNVNPPVDASLKGLSKIQEVNRLLDSASRNIETEGRDPKGESQRRTAQTLIRDAKAQVAEANQEINKRGGRSQ